MSEWLWIVAVVVGVVLVLGGTAILVFRRRWAENVERAGLTRETGSSATRYGIGIGVVQLLLGAGLIGTGLVGAPGLASLGVLFERADSALGSTSLVVSVILIVSGALLSTVGVLGLRRVWRRRDEWGSNDGPVSIPASQRAHIGWASLAVVLGAFAIVGGVLLAVA